MGGFVERAVADDFGPASTQDIEPMQEVARGFMIETDKGHGFVLRRGGDINVVQLEELMIHYPADPNGILGGTAVAEFSDNVPIAYQLIEKRIFEFGLASIDGSGRLCAYRYRRQRKGCEHRKTLHKPDNDRVSSFARCQKR
jgi:hypothetical protein